MAIVSTLEDKVYEEDSNDEELVGGKRLDY